MFKTLDSCSTSPQLGRPISHCWCCTRWTPFTSTSTSHGPAGEHTYELQSVEFSCQELENTRSHMNRHRSAWVQKAKTNLEDCRAVSCGRGKKRRSKSATRKTFVWDLAIFAQQAWKYVGFYPRQCSGSVGQLVIWSLQPHIAHRGEYTPTLYSPFDPHIIV